MLFVELFVDVSCGVIFFCKQIFPYFISDPQTREQKQERRKPKRFKSKTPAIIHWLLRNARKKKC